MSGIGGAERLIIDVALALQNRGHRVTIYTSHRDKTHCFDEARDGTLDVRVRGNTIFPAHLFGRFHILMASLRQLHLTVSLLLELRSRGNSRAKDKTAPEKEDQDDIFIVDQLPACVPVLKSLGRPFKSKRQRILFYCHFPDQLLARRNEGGSLLQLAKLLYRFPFDWFEGWAMSASDRVVANSNFSRGVVCSVFGPEKLGDVEVVYPCVDTTPTVAIPQKEPEDALWDGKKILLSINRFERKKDIGLAIRAYNGLGADMRKGTRLVIAGGYDNRVQENVQYHQELDSLAKDFGLKTATAKTSVSALSIPDDIDVLFLLSVPTTFKNTLLAQSKLLLYTPINEHFGIVPVEAMLAGLPVLASNTGGPLETVVEGETGWLRDAHAVEEWTAIMAKVLYGMSEKKLDKMATAGKARAERKFSLTAMGDRLEEEISTMLSAERRPFHGWQPVIALLVVICSFLAASITFLLNPPLPEHPKPQHASAEARRAAVRLGASSGLISSDLLDLSGFTDDFLDKPAKKRRVSDDKRSPPRQSNVVQESSRPGPSLFSFSDDDFNLPPSNPMAQKKYLERDVDESDHIVFTSSALEPPQKQRSAWSRPIHNEAEVITLDDDEDDLWKLMGNGSSIRRKEDEIQEFSDPFGSAVSESTFDLSEPGISASMSGFSSKTAALLSALNKAPKEKDKRSNTKSGSRSQKSKDVKMDATLIGDFSDEVDGTSQLRQPATKKSGKLTTDEKEARAKARADAKAQRDLERQLEKERKQRLKEEKAKEKQLASDIAEVNKLKVDKKDSTGEMILDISSSFEGSSVGNQAVEFMKRLKVEYHFFTGPIPNVVKWRRKMNAKYNTDAGHWEPAAFHVLEEKHVLCLVQAQDFIDMIIDPPPGEEKESLETHVLRIKSAYPGCTIIYLIEGLTPWMRKNSNSRNRAYVAEVLAQYEPEPPLSQASAAPRRGRKSKRKPETTPPVDDDTIEDALLALQVTHSCLIHHTAAPPESAEWIKNFTEHVSTALYRREMMGAHDAAFCMENGQVKTGDNKLDTFVKMLQEVNRVTASMAYGITSRYSSVTDLVRGMQMHGPTMLEDVKKSANRNGALSDARIGPAASKRLYKVFTGLDPTSTDV
ncbi:hypothetical protein F1880_002489 [Penicillium rolfsii]|nr:hypothetical protein F1880_002489 [Penicillium rolfsii]